MKSIRQWRNFVLSDRESTTDFLRARKLFLEYTGYGHEDNAQWRAYFFTAVSNRIFVGRWNTHHGIEVSNALYKFLYEEKQHVFPVSEEDDYTNLLAADNTPYRLDTRMIGKHTGHQSEEDKKLYPTPEELEQFKDEYNESNGRTYKAGTIVRDGKSYKVSQYGDSAYILKSIVRSHQVYDLLDAIQKQLGNTPINRKGDLAKILQVIKEDTDYSIAVKYADYGLDHIGAMGKDFIDTFKSYKSNSNYYLVRDLKQPLVGVDNTVRGLFSILSVPFVFARNALSLLFATRSWEDFKDNLVGLFEEPLDYLVDGICSTIRGVTQIVTTPLTYLFKIPLRLAIGKFQNEKPLIENDESIQSLAEKNTPEAIQHIYRKYLKGVERGRETKIDKKKELTFFQKASTAASNQYNVKNDKYVNLFRSTQL